MEFSAFLRDLRPAFMGWAGRGRRVAAEISGPIPDVHNRPLVFSMRRRALQLGALALGVIASAGLDGSYPAVPLRMTCGQFASLDAGEQLRLIVWMDGYSKRRVRPAAHGQLARVVRGCRQAPDVPVRDQIARVRPHPPSS